MKPFGRFGTRLRAELRAWFSSRAELARLEAERVERAERLEREAAEADPLVAIAGGGGVALFDSMGNAWTASVPGPKTVSSIPNR